MHRLLTAVFALALCTTSFAQDPGPSGSIYAPPVLTAGASNTVSLELPDQAGQVVQLVVTDLLSGQTQSIEVPIPDHGEASVAVNIPANWGICNFSVPGASSISVPASQEGPQSEQPKPVGTEVPQNETEASTQ